MYDEAVKTFSELKRKGSRPMSEKDAVERPFSLSLLGVETERAYWAAYRVTKSAALAEDAVQEAYASMLARPPQCQNEEHLRTCFFTIVHRQALLLMRGEGRRRRREIACAEKASFFIPAGEAASASNELAVAARRALNSLPLEERTVVSLCCEQGFSRERAAEVLSIPRSTVTLRVNRGLAKLRKILAKQGYTAATPLAVGTALSSLPLPPLSESLAAALQNIAANPAAYVPAQTIALSVRTAGFFGSKAAFSAIGALVCVAVGGGVWLWKATPLLDDEQRTMADHREFAAIEKAEQKPDETEKTGKVYRRWSFKDGPPNDLKPIIGQWRWERGKDGVGRMAVVKDHPDDYVSFVLSEKLPARPLCVTLKGLGQEKLRVFWGTHWALETQDAIPYNSWTTKKVNRSSNHLNFKFRIHDRWISCYGGNEDLLTVNEYKEPYPASRLRISFDNILLEEIELREMPSAEVEKYAGLLKAKLAELEKEGVQPKDAPGIRRLPNGKLEHWR
jgi:RNA polymerase sigma-70 factor (ECF subfamily)